MKIHRLSEYAASERRSAMTELEIMERARSYMEMLANGVNPLNGEYIPEDEVVNNVRLSRCFFYVADVLRQVIENGGVTAAKPVPKGKKQLFSLSHEQRERYEISGIPLTVTEFAKRISALSDTENMQKLCYKSIRKWFIEVGLLYEETLEGKRCVCPTEAGLQNGIWEEERVRTSGEIYKVVRYGPAAQQLVMDNLDAIIAINNRPKTETAYE